MKRKMTGEPKRRPLDTYPEQTTTRRPIRLDEVRGKHRKQCGHQVRYGPAGW